MLKKGLPLVMIVIPNGMLRIIDWKNFRRFEIASFAEEGDSAQLLKEINTNVMICFNVDCLWYDLKEH